jgi:KUP system potassium uptake protein
VAEKQTEQIISEKPERLQGEAGPAREELTGQRLVWASLAVLGVVYGDIGTSPLYAFRDSFTDDHSIPITPANVFGVLSLIFWSLVIIISIKYIIYVMRADNRGEGGILALLALVVPGLEARGRRRILVVLGVFGAALLYGDGVITPAISVLSAIEGLSVATPRFQEYQVLITVAILALLFIFQQRGTAGVAAVFGPIMLVWFLVLSALGISNAVQQPSVFAAVNPLHAIRFFVHNGWSAFVALGSVFLVVTGGEALYADMGHFGRSPIRLAWFSLVLPALLLNYFGQGALLLSNPNTVINPFYLLAPDWALYPMVALATAATIIASQAIISGAFSLTRQAVLLGFFPRLRIVQTSPEEIGQIYIPSINWLLMIATIALVVGFRTSTNLTGAYGVAIATTMVITTSLAFALSRERWRWSLAAAMLVTAGFLAVDLPYFGSNLLKIEAGGWVPLSLGVFVFTLMTTWRHGRTILQQRVESYTEPLDTFLRQIAEDPPVRVPGTAVFMTGRQHGAPAMLLHHLTHNQVLHERVVLLTVVIEEIPRVRPSRRMEIDDLGQGFTRVILHFGFIEDTNVIKMLRLGKALGLDIKPEEATYYVGHQAVIASSEGSIVEVWRKRLFVLMARNAADAMTFYHLPVERVFELGIRIEL